MNEVNFAGTLLYNYVMYFVYVLYSKLEKHFYIGFTKNLKKRLNQHLHKEVYSTKNILPKLIYFEGYINQDDALGREKFLKGGSGHKYLKKQLKNYLVGQ